MSESEKETEKQQPAYPSLETWADKLTWYPWPADSRAELTGRAGMVIKELDARGTETFAVLGEYDYGFRDGGCGCCSGAARPIAYAYLQELLVGVGE